jgi:hypothetical protein
MGVPVNDPNHVAEGVALLTSHYLNKANVTGMVRALMLRFQLYETAFQNFLFDVVLDNHPLPGGPWDILDKIGSIVEVPRLGRNDADYVFAIKLRIRVLRSHGLSEDIIQIAALIVPPVNAIVGGVLVVIGAIYRDWPPAAFEIQAIPINSSQRDALLEGLGEAKSTGTEGFLRYSYFPLNQIITWGSSITGGGIGFDSSRTPGTPANVPASLRLLTAP